MRAAPAPLWTWLVAGWLLGATVGELRSRQPPAVAAGHPLIRPEPTDPVRMSPRTLRTLPGIGRGRALAAARARWQHAGSAAPLRWEDVPGIGPRTAEAIHEWCVAHGQRTDGVFVPGVPAPSSARHSLSR